jgi:hypothetical protein
MRSLQRHVSLAVVVLVSAAQSRAQIQSIPPFVGAFSETFEAVTPPPAICIPARIFGQHADFCTPSGADCRVGNSVGYFSTGAPCICPQCTIYPNSGAKLLSTEYVWEVTFDTAALRFGGWFNAFLANEVATFEFYDIDDHLVAVDVPPIATPCQWTWFGWDLSNGPPIKRIFAQRTLHWFLLDDLQADLAPPAPAVYCTAGTTTHGCSASITASANPKLAHTTPCQITIAGVEGQKVGVIFYGLAKQLIPWCTGGIGTSTLCVKPPILSTTAQGSGGVGGQCNGAFQLDWNAYQVAHPSALGTPWTASERVFVQAWFRDPQACRSMNLSNAVVLAYQP